MNGIIGNNVMQNSNFTELIVFQSFLIHGFNLMQGLVLSLVILGLC